MIAANNQGLLGSNEDDKFRIGNWQRALLVVKALPAVPDKRR